MPFHGLSEDHALHRRLRAAGPILLVLAAASAATLAATSASAQVIEKVPELEGLDIVEKRGETIPKGLIFRDGRGSEVSLSQIADGSVPVLLSLNYGRCPKLCSVQLNGIADSLEDLAYDPGAEFRFVSVSIDPLESYQTAGSRRTEFVRRIGREVTGRGVEFLTGSPKSIKTLADAVGFQYRYQKDRRQYVHFPVLIVLTPEGRISQYLYGVSYPPGDVRLALFEAGEGRIGGVYEKLLMSCFQFDATKGKYTASIWAIMRFFGVVWLCILAAVLVPAWLGGSRIAAGRSTDATISSHVGENETGSEHTSPPFGG